MRRKKIKTHRPYVTKTIRARPLERKYVPRKEFLEMQNLLFTLQALSQRLVSELNVENILTQIMKTLGEALTAVWVNIWELTPDGKAAIIKQGYGRKGTEVYIEHSREHPLKLGTAFIGRTLKTKKTWTSSDMWKDPHLPRTWIRRVKEQNFRAIVCTPQFVESAKVVGGMCVYFDKPRVLSDFELRLVTIAANQAAVAIVNAGIYGELLAERDKTLAIINSLNEGVILYDNEERVLMMNPKAQDLLFVRSKEIVGQKLTKELAERSVFLKNAYLISHLTLADYETREYAALGPRRATIEVISIPVQGSGHQKIGSLRILRDITREKEVELLKTKFVSTASHQLRTPLSGLRWALESLQKDEGGTLTPPQHDLIEKSSTAVKHLAGLLDDLLNISKIEEGRLVYTFRKEYLPPLVKKILKDFSIQIKERNLDIALQEPASPMPIVHIDPDILSMAVNNIIDNAVRYSHQGGKIKISLDTGEHAAILSVKDEGIGIPEEDKKFIFTKFFRAKNAQLFQTEGSGLGLYLAKQIVEKHNGRIVFESREKKGSEFSIYLPIETPKMPEPGQSE
ncbi:MAG: GAF domain-containing protein [Candidatus Sungbacteria bacterium]|nr:GAF domain-containing protein [Candidatus Sungbacteria bacterium]